jgi:hypothetical protein
MQTLRGTETFFTIRMIVVLSVALENVPTNLNKAQISSFYERIH